MTCKQSLPECIEFSRTAWAQIPEDELPKAICETRESLENLAANLISHEKWYVNACCQCLSL